MIAPSHSHPDVPTEVHTCVNWYHTVAKLPSYLSYSLPGSYPEDWVPAGSSVFLFSLLFGIAVLATPTALMVGTGARLLAKNTCKKQGMILHLLCTTRDHQCSLSLEVRLGSHHRSTGLASCPLPTPAGVAAQHGTLIKSVTSLPPSLTRLQAWPRSTAS